MGLPRRVVQTGRISRRDDDDAVAVPEDDVPGLHTLAAAHDGDVDFARAFAVWSARRKSRGIHGQRKTASRIGPSTTIPASLLDAAYRNMSSPIRERPDSPPDTMSTSPSSAMLRALWIIRLSPGRAFTVKATPDMVPTGSESRRTSGVMAHIRCMASATGAVANAP